MLIIFFVKKWNSDVQEFNLFGLNIFLDFFIVIKYFNF